MVNQKENKMNIPYDTGKVKIGLNYQSRPYVENDKDMLYVQKCLLNKQSKNIFLQFFYKVLYG